MAADLGLLGFLKGIAWPVVVLVIAIAYKPAVLSFVPKLFAMLLRGRELEVFGVFKLKVDPAEQQQKTAELAKAESSTAGTVELKEIPGLVRTAAIGRLEEDLHGRLKDIVGAEPIASWSGTSLKPGWKPRSALSTQEFSAAKSQDWRLLNRAAES